MCGATGAFTRRGSVYDGMPYTRFSDLELLVVEKALRLVWHEAPQRFNIHCINFNTANEEQISSALYLVFNDLWANDRHLLADLAKVFLPVPIYDGPSGAVDYLGHELKFRPDLAFRRNYTDAGISTIDSSLFIEAKLVERGKTMGWYCGTGLSKFVRGTYAWAMPQAMMLGYVRNTTQILPHSLATHLAPLQKRDQYCLKEGPKPFPLSGFTNRSYLTLHNRPWLYPGTKVSPGPISVLHLWLSV